MRMAKTATAGQQARAKVRELRTRQAAQRAEQDRRIEASIELVLTSQRELAEAKAALAAAQDSHAKALRAADGVTAKAARALKDEGLSPADIAALTGLTLADVRRASRTEPTSSGPASGAPGHSSPAVTG
jgi:hypothetical protein